MASIEVTVYLETKPISVSEIKQKWLNQPEDDKNRESHKQKDHRKGN